MQMLIKKTAKEYIAKLEDLKQDMHNQIDNLPHKDIVTFHEAAAADAGPFPSRAGGT